MAHNPIAVAFDAAQTAAFNLETIIALLEGQDILKVSGSSLGALLRPILVDIYAAYDEIKNMPDEVDK